MDSAPTQPIKKKGADDAAPAAPSADAQTRPRGPHAPLVWWVWPLGIGLGLAAAAVAWTALFAAPLPSLPADAVAPYFTVYPPPSFTPVPPTLTATPFHTPTTALPTVIPGTIGIGVRVEVTEDGLRLRGSPSLTGEILSQASAHELFTIVEGPRQADGYTWWLLQGVFDTDRQGWAVENYLQPA
jgi:hypothetical protein